jgi:hemerythrin-like domain-containing protein
MSRRLAVERLCREHDDIFQVLVLLDSELASVGLADGETDDTLTVAALAYLAQLVEEFHHVKEDRACEALFARMPGARARLAEIPARHARVRESGAAVRAAFERVMLDQPVARRDLAEAGFTYSTELRRSVELEEHELIPVLDDLLDEGDWERIELEARKSAPPVRGQSVHEAYERLFHELERRFGVEPAPGKPATPR